MKSAIKVLFLIVLATNIAFAQDSAAAKKEAVEKLEVTAKDEAVAKKAPDAKKAAAEVEKKAPDLNDESEEKYVTDEKFFEEDEPEEEETEEEINAKINDFYSFVTKGSVYQIKKMIKAGMDVNTRSLAPLALTRKISRKKSITTTYAANSTPLHIAAGEGNFRLVALLIDKGARLNTKDDDKYTPFHRAVLYAKYRYGRNFKVMKYLMSKGAAMNTVNKDGVSPMFEAALHHHISILKYCKRNGAKLNLFDLANRAVLGEKNTGRQGAKNAVIKFFLRERMNANATDTEGRTLLMKAIQFKYYTIAKTLISHRANVNAIDNNGYYILIGLIKDKNYGMINYLLRRRAMPSIVNTCGGSPLHYTLLYHPNNRRLLLTFLRRQSTDINAKTNTICVDPFDKNNTIEKNITPLNMANSGGDEKIIKLVSRYDRTEYFEKQEVIRKRQDERRKKYEARMLVIKNKREAARKKRDAKRMAILKKREAARAERDAKRQAILDKKKAERLAKKEALDKIKNEAAMKKAAEADRLADDRYPDDDEAEVDAETAAENAADDTESGSDTWGDDDDKDDESAGGDDDDDW
ncbi:MAG: hypothetical protein GY754_03375 [bacterium]|nr:hypothetical protein [bacterium]